MTRTTTALAAAAVGLAVLALASGSGSPQIRRTVASSSGAGAGVGIPVSPSSIQAPEDASPTPRFLGLAGAVGPGGSATMTGTAAVALTFDDGPDPNLTPQLLDLLQQYRVKATFCVVGFRARDHPDLVRRIVAEGHTVCSHSWQHLTGLAGRDISYIRWDLTQTNQVIHDAAPDAQIKYFRAAGGNFTPGLVAIASEYGMAPIFWDVDPRDWDHSGYGRGQAMINAVVSRVQRATRPGSIVLSHDNGQPTTIAAYRVLLPWLMARFQLIPLPT